MKSKLLIILTTAILSLTTNVTFGQVAPNLKTTASFALFTGTGAFDNLGASIITGNVGSHAVSPTGFTGSPLGTVVGNIYNASDGITATAAADVLTAYTDLFVQSGAVLAVVMDGMILTPGVYSWGAATSLAGNLTLNGSGIYVIQVDGALSMAAGSNVILSGGANLCDVYWQVNGAFTLNTGSVFRGTLIATGAIHLLEASSLFGRALSTTGAIDTHNNVVTIGSAPNIPGAISGTTAQCSALAGQTYSISAVANASTYSWVVPTGWSITAGTGTTGITVITGAAGQNGNITVTAGNGCGTSAASSIAVTANPAIVASVSIAALPTGAICAGTSVTFTATPTNGGTTPAYQWKKGGTNISGETNSTYTSTTLANTDAITVVMTSNATPCLTGSPTTSNTITMTVTVCGLLTADFTGTPLTVYVGSNVTFTNTSTGTTGSTTYSWDFGTGASIATAATSGPHVVSYTTSGLKTVTLTISDGTTDTKTKANYITVNPLLIAGVSVVSAPSGAISSGTSVTFTATPTNGGLAPTYIWKKDGLTITGETGLTYTTSTLLNGAVITVEMTSNEVGVTGNPATSAPINMIITPAAIPVTIGTQPTNNSMCVMTGNSSFTVVPAGTGPFTYQWQYNNGSTWAAVVNGTPGGAVYINQTTATLGVSGITAGGSYQYRTYVTNNGGADNATSNVVTLIVNAVPSAPVFTITQPDCITATGSAVFSGLPAGAWTLTRTPGAVVTNGSGANYTISGLAAGTYTYTLTDAITLCTSAPSANVVINTQPVTPSVANQTAAIASGATFTVAPAGVPVGTTYSWIAPVYTNGVTGGSAQTNQSSISEVLFIPTGTGIATYTVTPTSGVCVGVPFTVIVTVTSACVPVTIGTQSANTTMCIPSGSASFTVLAAGTAPFTYQWQYNNGGVWAAVANGIPSGAVYSNQTTTTLGISGITVNGSYQYRSYVTNCTGSSNVLSNAATLAVNTIPAAPVIGKITQTDCFVATGSVILSGLPAAGTWTLTRTPGGTVTTGTGASTTIAGVPIGTYTYTVTDGLSICTSIASANVIVNPQPIPAAPTVSIVQPDCAIPLGTIFITAPTGAGLTYSIDGTNYTNTSGVFQNVPMGTYTVTAKNADGCIYKK